MPSAAQEHYDIGLQAYRQGMFAEAKVAFSGGLELDRNHWEMRLYLGMTHVRLEEFQEAKAQFLQVRDLCPDAEVRRKAQTALAAISPNVSQQGIKRLSSQQGG